MVWVSPARAERILDILEETHPDARIYLEFDGPFQLLIATILAAQCTDERVNTVTPELFARYPTPAAMAGADPAELREAIRPTGFFRRKTESILACCKSLVEEHGGEVPADMEALTRMAGVGRKTASVVLLGAFGRPAVAVDTHVGRVARRLGLAKGPAPDKIEARLCELIRPERRARATLLLGTHGRRICPARKPDCANCPLCRLCDYGRAAQKD